MTDTSRNSSTFSNDLQAMLTFFINTFSDPETPESEVLQLETCKVMLTKLIVKKEARRISRETGMPLDQIMEEICIPQTSPSARQYGDRTLEAHMDQRPP